VVAGSNSQECSSSFREITCGAGSESCFGNGRIRDLSILTEEIDERNRLRGTLEQDTAVAIPKKPLRPNANAEADKLSIVAKGVAEAQKHRADAIAP